MIVDAHLKCDRLLPHCSSCQKYRRVCNYERPGKTPLTRRHLTHVEEELSRAKALLSELQSRQRRENTNGSSMSPPEVNIVGKEPATPSLPLSQSTEYRRNNEIDVAIPQQNLSLQGYFDSSHSRDAQPPETEFCAANAQTASPDHQNLHTPCSNRVSRSNRDIMISLETPPTSGSFEWDERNGQPGGQKFVDGMGSLTSDVDGSGYLGVASGAALLRITVGNNSHHSGTTSPRVATIPFAITSLSALDGYIDDYFSLYHRSYPIVHEATFRAQFMEIIPRPSGNAWQVLLYVVAALGAWSTATQRSDVHTGLFEAAKARFSIDLLETGNLVLVQALTLMSNYAQMGNKPNSSYNYYGLARRIAMGIGLHKEFSAWQLNPLVVEMRRRVWWCLYVFDVGSIITFSRPFDFPQSGVDVELPINVHDTDLTISTTQRPPPADTTTVYSHLRAQCSFHMATCNIYERMISNTFPTAKEMTTLDDMSIFPWLNSLPHYFQPHAIQPPKYAFCHATLQWRYRNLRILAYRPFLVRRAMSGSDWGQDQDNSDDLESIDIAFQRCLDASRESVELISSFWFNNSQTMMASWYGLYFLFQAVLIPIVCLRNNPQSDLAGAWRDQIRESIRVLESMMRLNPTASRCLRVVTSLTESYISNEEEINEPTQESWQDQLTGLYPMMWPELGSDFAQLDRINALQESTITDFMNRMSAYD
ncbi:fungal-specific transcription factor domain-containing protein [Trichoderma sp. SZMC 28013]